MISFSYKKVGYLLIVIELIFLLVAFIPVFSFLEVDEKSGSIFGWLFLCCLVLITFSKENTGSIYRSGSGYDLSYCQKFYFFHLLLMDLISPAKTSVH